MVTPFGRPETINTYSDQSVDRSQRRTVIYDTPYTAHNPPKWPVADQNSDGQERHWNDGNHKIGDRLIDDEGGEVRAEFLLVLVREDNEEVGYGADGSKDEKKCANDDYEDAGVSAR